jgi:hypothetical protein
MCHLAFLYIPLLKNNPFFCFTNLTHSRKTSTSSTVFLVSIIMIFSSLLARSSSAFSVSGSRTLRTSAALFAKAGQAEVVLVGCGAPNRGMGWYHGLQMVEARCPSASLDYVVEPWFMGGGKDSPGGPEFAEEVQKAWSSKYGVQFATSLSELPKPKAPRLALISGRTADNPRYVEKMCQLFEYVG